MGLGNKKFTTQNKFMWKIHAKCVKEKLVAWWNFSTTKKKKFPPHFRLLAFYFSFHFVCFVIPFVLPYPKILIFRDLRLRVFFSSSYFSFFNFDNFHSIGNLFHYIKTTLIFTINVT